MQPRILVPKLEIGQILIDFLGLHKLRREKDQETSYGIPARRWAEGLAKSITSSLSQISSLIPVYETNEENYQSIKEELIEKMAAAKSDDDLIDLVFLLYQHAVTAQGDRNKNAPSKLCQNLFAIRSIILTHLEDDPAAKKVLIAKREELRAEIIKIENDSKHKDSNLDVIEVEDDELLSAVNYIPASSKTKRNDISKIRIPIQELKLKLALLETDPTALRKIFEDENFFDFLLTKNELDKKKTDKDVFPMQLTKKYHTSLYKSDYQPLEKVLIDFERFTELSRIKHTKLTSKLSNNVNERIEKSLKDSQKVLTEEVNTRKRDAQKRQERLNALKAAQVKQAEYASEIARLREEAAVQLEKDSEEEKMLLEFEEKLKLQMLEIERLKKEGISASREGSPSQNHDVTTEQNSSSNSSTASITEKLGTEGAAPSPVATPAPTSADSTVQTKNSPTSYLKVASTHLSTNETVSAPTTSESSSEGKKQDHDTASANTTNTSDTVPPIQSPSTKPTSAKAKATSSTQGLLAAKAKAQPTPPRTNTEKKSFFGFGNTQ